MDCKVNDTFCLVDKRMNKLDHDFFGAVTRHTEALATFDIQMTDSKARLFSIEETYCTQADMLLKADVAAMLQKANAIDVDQVKSATDMAMTRIDALIHTTKQGQDALDAQLTKRLDRKAEWILRSLRKEFREKQSADIGKVKCLVCDQPVPQNPEVETNVHGGEPFPLKPTLHSQGRTRDITDDGKCATATDGVPTSIQNNPSRVRPASATSNRNGNFSNQDYQYNRKLVSLGAAPKNNILTAILQEQQQRLQGVFENESSIYSGQDQEQEQEQERKLQAPPQKSFPPQRNIHSASSSRQQQQQQQQNLGPLSQEYFESLEFKYSHTNRAPANPLLAAANKRARPGSAPAWKARK
jgi:hypothetical protein